MGLDELLSGRELIIKHNNSIKDLPSKGLKEYCPNNSWLEGKQIQVQLEERYNFIKAERIEKSNSVAQAEWIPHLQKAKLTKHFGKLWETLGHHQDNEDWLLPEEALFLIENSELQLFFNDVSLSVEDCYELVFNEGGCSFDEYKVFSYLCRAGYRVIRHSSSVRVTHYEKQVRLDAIVQNQKRDAPDGKEMALVSASEKSNLPTIAESRSESPEVEIIAGPSSVTPKAERSQSAKGKKPGVPEETIVLIESDDDDNNIEIKEISDSDSDSDVVCISSPSYNSPNSNSRGWYPKLDKCLRRTLEQVVDLCDDEHDNGKCNIRNRMDLIRASKSEILARLPNVENVVTSFVVADRMLLPPNSVPKFSEYKTRVNIKTDDSRYQNDFNDRRISIYERPQFNGTPNGFDNYNNFQQNHAAPPGVGEYDNFNDGALNGVGNFNNFLQNPLLAKAQQMQAMAMNMIQTANRLMTVMSTANNNPNELWDLLGSGGNAVARFGHRPGPPFMHHHPRFSGYQRRPYRHHRPYRRRPWGQRRPYHNAHSDNYAIQPPSDNIKPESNENDVVVLSDGDDAVEVMENDNEVKPLAKRKNVIVEAGEKRCKIDPDLDGESETSSCIMVTPSENCKKASEEDDRIIKKEIKPIIKNENENNQSTSQLPISDNTSAIISIKSESENSLDSSAFSQSNELSLCQSPVHEKSKTQNVITPNEKEATSAVEMAKTCDNHSSQPNYDVMEVEQMDVSVEPSNEPCSSKPAGKELETPVAKTQEEPAQIPNEQPGGISSWEQYKNSDNDQDLDDSLIRLDGYVSYGNILSSLKIFNQIEAKTQRNNFKISFDVYLPDSHFKKSLKVLPNYRVIILKPKDNLPTSVDIEGLKISYQDGIPFLFTVVYSETISFYMYDSVTVNTLCD